MEGESVDVKVKSPEELVNGEGDTEAVRLALDESESEIFDEVLLDIEVDEVGEAGADMDGIGDTEIMEV